MPPPKDPERLKEYKERMSKLKIVQYQKDPAIKQKIRDANIGKTCSDKTKMIMSVSKRGTKNPNFGKAMSEEQKMQISTTKTGTHQTEETKVQRSLSLKKFYESHPDAGGKKGEQLSGFNRSRSLPEEQRKKMSAAKQGENHPNFGKHLPEATREKIRIANSGENCYHYGQSPTDETRRKMSEALKGDKCYNWKGGITAVNHSIRTCLQYREWIMAIFKRDNFTCQDCGATKVYLHAHHIRLFSDIMQENNITSLEEALLCDALWDVSNGRSLCELCHKREHFGVADEDEEPAVAEVGG